MPIYEYICRNCGHELEQLQRLSDGPLTECPACGESALKRKVSAAGFRLSGGGWYETDFKSDGRRNIAGDAKSNGSTDAGKDKSKSDAGKSDKVGESKSTGEKSTKADSGNKTKTGGSASKD